MKKLAVVAFSLLCQPVFAQSIPPIPIGPGGAGGSGGGGGGGGGANTFITSPPPTSSSATISGIITNPANGGSVNGVTVTVYKNGSTSVCSGTTNSSGAWSCSASGLANGDVLYANAAIPVLSSTQTAAISGSDMLLLVDGVSMLLLADGVSFLLIIS